MFLTQEHPFDFFWQGRGVGLVRICYIQNKLLIPRLPHWHNFFQCQQTHHLGNIWEQFFQKSISPTSKSNACFTLNLKRSCLFLKCLLAFKSNLSTIISMSSYQILLFIGFQTLDPTLLLCYFSVVVQCIFPISYVAMYTAIPQTTDTLILSIS